MDNTAFWRTGVTYGGTPQAGAATLALCSVSVASDDETLGPGTDESYSLRIDDDGVTPCIS